MSYFCRSYSSVGIYSGELLQSLLKIGAETIVADPSLDNIIFGFKLSLFVVDKEDFSKSDPSIFVILSIEESEALSIGYLAL